jgi:hypothetical protein
MIIRFQKIHESALLNNGAFANTRAPKWGVIHPMTVFRESENSYVVYSSALVCNLQINAEQNCIEPTGLNP